MKGLQIFLHSVPQVTGNLSEALRVSLVPYAIQMAVALSLMGPLAVASQEPALRFGGEGPTENLLSALLVVLATGITSVWVTIAWHRFVLKGETPTGWVPGFAGGRSWKYFLRSLGIVLLCIVAAIPLGVVVGGIAATVLDPLANSNLLGLITSVFVILPISFISYRLSAALPAPALDKVGPLTEGWDATKDAKGAIWLLSLMTTVLMSGLSYLASLILGDSIAPAIVWELVFGWVVLMIGLSILTTLYGHYIEGRPLV